MEWDELTGTDATVPVSGDEWGGFFAANASASGEVRQVPVVPLQVHWHSTAENVVDGELEGH